MRTEKDFLGWLYGMSFYHGTTRYGQFPGHHVFCAKYEIDYSLRELLDELEGGDNEAIDAGTTLRKMHQNGEIYLTYNDCPVKAMSEIVDIIRDYYFNILNGNDK